MVENKKNKKKNKKKEQNTKGTLLNIKHKIAIVIIAKLLDFISQNLN
jgi:hypothetical protein